MSSTTNTNFSTPNAKCSYNAYPNRDSPLSALLRCARCHNEPYCSRECQTVSWPAHKLVCRSDNYVLTFQLHPDKITNPPVEHILSCLATPDFNFYDLHLALQTAFCWATTHTFDFAVIDPDFVKKEHDLVSMIEMARRMAMGEHSGAPREYLLRLVDPMTRIKNGSRHPVDDAHRGWREHPGTKEKMAHEMPLCKFFEDKRWEGKQMVYVYDFGDNWEHFMTVVGRAPATDQFEYVGETGHYVAEDVGFWKGWEELKEAYRAAEPTEEQIERRDWFETMAANGDPLGLYGDRVDFVDEEEIREKLAEMWSISRS